MTRCRSVGVSSERAVSSNAVAEAAEIGLAQRQARRRGVAAELEYQSGMAHGDPVERVAQVQSRNGAPRAPDLVRVAARERDGRAVKAVLDARRRRCRSRPGASRDRRGSGCRLSSAAMASSAASAVLLHAGFDLAPLAVEAVEFRGDRQPRGRSRRVTRHSMPSDMSVSRPAAFSRGPATKPRS